MTHSHLDHSPLARPLAHVTGAPVLAFGPSGAGRSPAMSRIVAAGYAGGGEGVDAAFTPDILLADGETVATGEWSLTARHTPGHFGNHLSFQQGSDIFCGDLVLGWSSTLISPPDGDLTDYFRSMARLQCLGAARLYPAHGAPIEAPAARLAELVAHRRDRTRQILEALASAPGNARELAARIYDVGPTLIHAASRNVLAHLIALDELGAVRHDDEISEDSRFYLK
ncbi:beta-lactamase domain-containing protein [Paracoccus aminophilus JCM 7686]|uniref:Beta-lactamase domain-containing protein n=1 Tax=Paracoccus aminophilus JCM 7686 TaxID=1367847 RepID=S5XM81_PARAH|nr:beta-lactamase domain-containing protein [Paracoccus aminophilus JCM 7686]